VGRAHGLDGSFYVDGADADFAEGAAVTVAGRATTVERRAGTDARPLIRLAGLDGRELRGQELMVDEPLAEDEFAAADLVGCAIPGLGQVRRVINAPSCDLLEADVLVPFVRDAIVSVDLERRVIEVDRDFLGLG
jgi:16S rRNA processing protein RimM